MIITGIPDIDYIRLTSFDEGAGHYFRAVAENEFEHYEPVDKKRLQYSGQFRKGELAGSCFVGTGEQDKRRHHMLDIAGIWASQAWEYLQGLSVRCTRIDLQITLKITQHHNARNLADQLRDLPFNVRGRHPSITLFESDRPDNADSTALELTTIQVGTRQSERMMRIYVKPDAAGEQYLRFECQFSGTLAQTVFDGLSLGAMTVQSVLVAELKRLPQVDDPMLIMMRQVVNGEATPIIHIASPESDTLRWYHRQVAPSLIRMLKDDTVEGAMDVFLERVGLQRIAVRWG